MGGNEAPKAIAILTASRASLSKAENNKRNAELRKLIKMATYNVKEGEERIGFFKVIGTYAETQADGTTKRVKEDSTVVVAPANQAQKLKKMAMVLGAKFDQDSIFFAENGQAMLIYTRDVMDEAGNVEFNKGHITRLGAFHPQQLGMAFTKIKGKTFAFEWIGEQLEYGNPSCYNEAMMFESFAKHFDSSDDPLVEWEAKVKSVKEEIEQIEEGCKKKNTIQKMIVKMKRRTLRKMIPRMMDPTKMRMMTKNQTKNLQNLLISLVYVLLTLVFIKLQRTS